MSVQNDIERIMDLHQRGIIDTAEANVCLVEAQGVKVVTRLPKDVRTALNAAVKSRRLMRMKKDSFMPEVYYRPASRVKAIEIRNEYQRDALNRLNEFARVNNKSLKPDPL